MKDVDLVCKLAARVVDTAEKDADARAHDAWDSRAIGRLEKDLDARRKELSNSSSGPPTSSDRRTGCSRGFPTPSSCAVPGLCRVVTRKEIEAADWSLTPGRYVGVAPPEVDEDFDFEQTLRDIHIELADLNEEAVDARGEDSGELRGGLDV